MVRQEVEVEVIHSWPAPRSLSTSLMYSFAQKDDIEVLDEPLYATFLKVTGIERPYREELLSKMEYDGDKVVKEIIFGPGEKKYRYCKHIAKQRTPGLPSDLMKKGKHFILIRSPLDILPSFGKVVPPSFLDLGLAELVSIYNDLSLLGRSPPVIDAADLQQSPEATLQGLCEDLNIPFQAAMLRSHLLERCLNLKNPKTGPKQIDGLWALWWYQSVQKSTCFMLGRKYPEHISIFVQLAQNQPFWRPACLILIFQSLQMRNCLLGLVMRFRPEKMPRFLCLTRLSKEVIRYGRA